MTHLDEKQKEELYKKYPSLERIIGPCQRVNIISIEEIECEQLPNIESQHSEGGGSPRDASSLNSYDFEDTNYLYRLAVESFTADHDSDEKANFTDYTLKLYKQKKQ